MGLEAYRKRRHFEKTKEPEGKLGKAKAEGKGGKRIFVVQEHHASHLHWDFRFEDEGVLKSWAVPKEPLPEEGKKRLAIQTEDHPLEYASFKGTIPEGEYGAGKVETWDKGKCELLEKSKDKYALELKGKKLKGKFFLTKFTRAGEKSWLFFKAKE